MNVKPGDLAIIIKAPWTPEMIGMIVKVERLAAIDEFFDTIKDGAPVWIVSSPNGIPVRYTNGEYRIDKQRPVSDSFLRPISGLSDNEEVKDEKLIKEIA